jgi:hypothetical protein
VKNRRRLTFIARSRVVKLWALCICICFNCYVVHHYYCRNDSDIQICTPENFRSEKDLFLDAQEQRRSQMEVRSSILEPLLSSSWELISRNTPLSETLFRAYYEGLYNITDGSGTKTIHFVNPPGFRKYIHNTYTDT